MKLSKRKIYALSGIVGIILIILLYVVFSGNTICNDIEINFISNSSEKLVDPDDIEKLVLAEYDSLIGSPISRVDLSLLESVIEKHPSVKNAEVYKKVKGVLIIDVENRIPIVRIIPDAGADFYIDSEGQLMPVSKIAGARVLVANGNFNYDYNFKSLNVSDDSLVTNTVRDIYKLASVISDDSFLRAQIEQIYIKEDGEYELIPKVGKHTVILGDIYNYEKKLKYLKHFYVDVLRTEGWRNYSCISLKYKGQIVCVKNK